MSAQPESNTEFQMIKPANTLKMKIGGSALKGLDASAVAKAEEAIKSLSNQFGTWLAEEITKLHTAHQVAKVEGLMGTPGTNLYLRSHDLKGLGSTYEYPIITRIAGSLCKLLDDETLRAKAPMLLVDAHIDAIKACVRDQMRDESHPVVKILAAELEKQVKTVLAS